MWRLVITTGEVPDRSGGALIAALVDAVSVELGVRLWRANRVEGVGICCDVFLLPEGGGVTVPSMRTEELVEACRGVEWFEWASLVGMPSSWSGAIEIETDGEDAEFRDFAPAVVEVRAFDGYLVEVYASNLGMLERLREEHGGKISGRAGA